MLNGNTAESEGIKAISVMQRLGCALVMQGEWWIQGLFRVFLILSFLMNGEGLCSVLVFSDQRISGLWASCASTVFFSPFESMYVWTFYQMFSSFSFFPGPPGCPGLTSIQCLWPLSACFCRLPASATSLGDHPSVHLSHLSAVWMRGTPQDGACILSGRICREHKTHCSFVFWKKTTLWL